jgi:hypothetical protein
MARPIKETPTLRGNDALRFETAMEHIVPATAARKQEIQDSYDWFKSHAVFPMT